MKAQLMMDEDVITVEDLMVKHKINVVYVEGSDILIPYWEANVYEKGQLLASSAGHTLAAAVETIVNTLEA